MAGRKTSRSWKDLVPLFADGESFRDAATKLGVSLSTVLRWSRDPRLRAALRELREADRTDVDNRAVSSTGRAWDVLMSILNDEMGTPPAIRIQAYDRVMKRASDAQAMALLVDPARATDADWYKAKIEAIQSALVATSSDVARQKLMKDLDMARTQLVGALKAGGAEVSDDERHMALNRYVDEAPMSDLQVIVGALRRRGLV